MTDQAPSSGGDQQLPPRAEEAEAPKNDDAADVQSSDSEDTAGDEVEKPQSPPATAATVATTEDEPSAEPDTPKDTEEAAEEAAETATAETAENTIEKPAEEPVEEPVEKEEEQQEEDKVEEEEEEDEEEEEEEEDEEDDEPDEDDEDDEPQLKYARLTQHLAAVYRNGDATSASLVAGDKMILGTHNGNIHVIQLPNFQPLRVYHAHSATVTSISISPFPPPLPSESGDAAHQQASQAAQVPPPSRQADQGTPSASRKPREPPPVPKIPSNDIYIATSSIDGNVCVQSLLDLRDVSLRNFARPVQTVSLSPNYKTDRTYLSGGRAGQLIVTTNPGTGRSTSTTTGTVAATASGWLGSMGLGANYGKDTVLHSGEGTISTIKWSLSGKYVVWLNEHGIKLIRTNLYLDEDQPDHAWRRIGHYDRPQNEDWETMASVWKGRVEWIDEQGFESHEEGPGSRGISSPATERLREQAEASRRGIERLLVGWGSRIWIMNVHPNEVSTGKKAGKKIPGRPEIVKILNLDCIISGIALYTQNLLMVLAYCSPDDEDEEEDDDNDDDKEKEVTTITHGHKSQPSTSSTSSQPSGGIARRQNNLRPELRLIDLDSRKEVSGDSLTVSRYERLTAGDYHLGILPPRNAAANVSSKGALGALAGISTDVWHAAINPKSLFNSAASARSSGDDTSSVAKTGSTVGPMRPGLGRSPSVHPGLVKPGAKIFIHSPYDCILGTKRDLSDHLYWLIERGKYEQAWGLLNDNPEILDAHDGISEVPSTPTKAQHSEDIRDDESIPESTMFRDTHSSAEKEKRRIADLWIQSLIDEGNWSEAGRICSQVIKTSDRWEKWVWTFVEAKKFDEITDFIPSELMNPPISPNVFEVILGHYLQTDKPRFKEVLDRWSTDFFNINTITTSLENQLSFRDVREDSIDDGEKGRDWRIVVESLARLDEANGRHREALKCYIKLHDADSTFRLIRDSHLAEYVADDIPSFIGLRVEPEELTKMTEKDLEEATSEAITLLVDEAQHGLVRPDVVVEQLLAQELHLYLYFYLRGLWKGEGLKELTGGNKDRLVMESQSLVDDFADLAVHLFAMYDRNLLMDFLKTSTSYGLEKAVQECEVFNYYDELVYLYSKTGQMKRALSLIIDRLKNVHKAIEFAKEQDDADLWDDLLNYSMDKPSFIRGLLEHAGTAFDPIKLVQRIPEGLEIPGLREGLTHMMKEQEIQYSISHGAAKVLSSEVAAAQKELRMRQRKAVKFEVVHQTSKHVDVEAKEVPTEGDDVQKKALEESKDGHDHRKPEPGHCAKCMEPFTEHEMETLVGYACGHVFHLSHLLEMLQKPGRRTRDVDLGYKPVEETTRYSVGLKVTRARLMRDRVKAGCPVCHTGV